MTSFSCSFLAQGIPVNLIFIASSPHHCPFLIMIAILVHLMLIAVKSIKKQHLVEVRSMANPPAAVKLALESICLLLGESTTDWKQIRSIIMRENFIPTIVNFSADEIRWNKRKYILKLFTEELCLFLSLIFKFLSAPLRALNSPLTPLLLLLISFKHIPPSTYLAVSSIKRQHLVEVRAMTNPPAVVKLALESICLMLGEETSDWKKIRQVIIRDNFISSIVNFSSEDMRYQCQNVCLDLI